MTGVEDNIKDNRTTATEEDNIKDNSTTTLAPQVSWLAYTVPDYDISCLWHFSTKTGFPYIMNWAEVLLGLGLNLFVTIVQFVLPTGFYLGALAAFPFLAKSGLAHIQLWIAWCVPFRNKVVSFTYPMLCFYGLQTLMDLVDISTNPFESVGNVGYCERFP